MHSHTLTFHLIADNRNITHSKMAWKKTDKHSMLLQLDKKLLRLNQCILPLRIGATYGCVSLNAKDVHYKNKKIPFVWSRRWSDFSVREI